MNQTILPGDILFVWGHSLIPEIITDITKGPSHIAMFIDSETVYEAQGFRKVGPQTLKYYLDGQSNLEVWSDSTLTEDIRNQMVEYIKLFNGASYNYLEILHQFIRYEFGIESLANQKFICSGLIKAVINHFGITWTSEEKPSPADFYSGNFSLKYKMKLK